ncbi:H-2 class I histocompatibility antigen, Q10 alpha chain-like [Tachysurus ichikawai]
MDLSCSLVKVLLFLMNGFLQTSAVTHSLQYLYTAITPQINLPEFTAVGLVDGGQIVYYDSNIRKMIPKTEWIQKVSADDPDYWKRETERSRSDHEDLHHLLHTVMKSFNHTQGVHTLQRMYGSKPQAVIIKNQWESTGAEGQYWKSYLETECIEWVKKLVYYGKETLERKVRPETSLFQKHSPSPEVVCHATGFFPKAVMISWRKDGEDVHEDVELRETLPNQDGSFQKRSILKVPAEELQKHTYTCVIQHSSLEKELVLNVRNKHRIVTDKVYRWSVVEWIISGSVVLAVCILGFVIWKKKKKARLRQQTMVKNVLW